MNNLRAARRELRRAAPAGGCASRVDINVHVSGATGKVMEMVREGVSQGIGRFAKSPAFTRSTANSLRDTKVTSGGGVLSPPFRALAPLE